MHPKNIDFHEYSGGKQSFFPVIFLCGFYVLIIGQSKVRATSRAT